MDNPYASAPTPDERLMATLAHVLQLFGGFIGPLVIYLIKRQESRFVAFHALQALIWQAFMFCATIVVVLIGMALMFAAMFAQGLPHGPSSQPPPGMFTMMALVYPFSCCTWVVNLVLAISYGVKANRGEWAEYPVIGGLAHKWGGV